MVLLLPHVGSVCSVGLLNSTLGEWGGGGGGNSKKVNTHPKIPEIDLDFFRLLLTYNKIVQILS